MSQTKAKIVLTAVCLPLLLAGCGKGWVAQPYHGTPYGTRTAGSGVEWVRGHMDPPATINPTPQTPPPAPVAAPQPPTPAPTAAPIKSAEPVFHKAVEK